MRLYYGTSTQSTDCRYDGYFKINNCGCFEDITKNEVLRKDGRLDYQLIYIKSGSMTVDQGGTPLSLVAGDAYLFRPGEAQNYRIGDTPTTYYWIHFTGSATEEILAFFRGSHCHVGPFPEIEHFCFSFYRSFRIQKSFPALTYEGRLIALLGKIGEHLAGDREHQSTERLAAVLDHIEAVFPRKPSNEELAAVCYMSKYHFIKIFKAAMGETPQGYMNRLLIEKAQLLLRDTALTVAEIAERLGVLDPLYFSRLFKKHVGASPLHYRKEQKA